MILFIWTKKNHHDTLDIIYVKNLLYWDWARLNGQIFFRQSHNFLSQTTKFIPKIRWIDFPAIKSSQSSLMCGKKEWSSTNPPIGILPLIMSLFCEFSRWIFGTIPCGCCNITRSNNIASFEYYQQAPSQTIALYLPPFPLIIRNVTYSMRSFPIFINHRIRHSRNWRRELRCMRDTCRRHCGWWCNQCKSRLRDGHWNKKCTCT